jgi:NADH-quinone oxidoreductase subunit K
MLSEADWLTLMLGLGALLFCAGFYLLLAKRNVLMVLIGLELMLNAANLNFVTFNRYYPNQDGTMMALFILVIAAAEAAVGLAILMAFWRTQKTTVLDNVN